MKRFIELMGVIPLGRRRVAKLAEGRYVIYLPTTMNDLWEALRGRPVKVYIEVEGD